MYISRHKLLCRWLPALVCLIVAVPLAAQNRASLKETMFGAADKLMAEVQAEQGDLLAPTTYKTALEKYTQALRSVKEGKKISDIESKLNEIQTMLDKCLKVARFGQIAFKTTLKAREDALAANAPEHAKELYESAEADFLQATKRLERNDIKGAKKRIPAIEALYRKAELSAIKVSIIGNVRNLMRQAKDAKANEVTPITFANAMRLLNESEAILNSNRRSQAGARERAEQAEIEAKHAIFLTRQIKRLKKNQSEWENFILDREVLIEAIAEELGFKAYFNEGMDKPLKGIRKIARTLQGEKRDLVQEVQQKNAEIKRLNETLQQYREKEAGLQAELQEKQYKLEVKRRHEELIHSVENMFTSGEAVVLRKGDELIIRLIGLSFPSGKSTIKPEFFSLLATVQRALRKLPNASITIEGHTDALGDARYNENLSYERASAVKEYLLANMGLDESRITAVGYGEKRPIASNESKVGRAQNRRIDIVVSPGLETL